MRCQLRKHSGEGWGLEYAITLSKNIVVLRVNPYSPASFSQLEEGDVLHFINGKKLSGLTRAQIDDLLAKTNHLDTYFTREDGLENNGTHSSSAAPTPRQDVIVVDDESSDSRDGPGNRDFDEDSQDFFSDDESIGATDSDGIINLISDDEIPPSRPPSPPRAPPPPEPSPTISADASSVPLSLSMNPSSASSGSPLPIHSPPIRSPSPTPRKRSRTTPSTPGITLKFEPLGFGCADVGDEVVEVPNPHMIAEQPASLDLDDDAIEVMGGHVTNANDMPHPRESCSNFRFIMNTYASSSSTANNLNFCPQCYCYVCEVKASECVDWSSHCDATRKLSTWRTKKTSLASPLMLLLHPSKRAHMSQMALLIQGLSAEELLSHITKAQDLLKTVTTSTDLNTQQTSYGEAIFILWSCLKRSITVHGTESKKTGTRSLISLGAALLMTKSFTAPYVPKNLCPTLIEELSVLSRSLVSMSVFVTSTMELLPVLINLASNRRTNPNWVFESSERSNFPTGLNLNADTSTLVYNILKEVGASQLTILDFVSIYNQTLLGSCFFELLKDLNIMNLQPLSQFICHILDRKSRFSFDVLRELQFSFPSLTFQHLFLLYVLLFRTESEFSSKQRKFSLLQSLSKVAIGYLEKIYETDLTRIRTLFTREGYEERNRTDSLLQIPQLQSAHLITQMEPVEIVSKYSEYTSEIMITDIFLSFLFTFLDDWSSTLTLSTEFDPPTPPQSNFLCDLFEIRKHDFVAMYFLHFGLLYFESSPSEKFFYLLSGVGLRYIRSMNTDTQTANRMSPAEFIYSFPTKFFNRWSRPLTLQIPNLPPPWNPSESLFCGVCRPDDFHLMVLLDRIGNEATSTLVLTLFKISWNVFLDLAQRTIKEYSDRNGALYSMISLLGSSKFLPYTQLVCPEISKLNFLNESTEIRLSTLREFKSIAKTRGEDSSIDTQDLPIPTNLWGLWQRVLPVLFRFDFVRKLIIEDFEPIRKGGRSFLLSLLELKANDIDLQNGTIPEIIWSIILEQHQQNPTETVRILDELASQKTPSILHDLIFYFPPRFANLILSSRSSALVFFVRDTEIAVSRETHPRHSFYSQISSLWSEISSQFAQKIDADITRIVSLSQSTPEDNILLEKSFYISIAIRLPYAIKRLAPLLFDTLSPKKAVVLKAMKIATAVEDLLLILQHTIGYLRKWGPNSCIGLDSFPLYNDFIVVSDPLVIEVVAIVNPSLETVSNYFESLNPTQTDIDALNQHWRESLSETDYLRVCLKYLSVEMLETFLEKFMKFDYVVTPSSHFFREAVDSIVVCYEAQQPQKSYLLIQWLVALLLSRSWENEKEMTVDFFQYLKLTETKIIHSGLPLTVPSSPSISFPSTKFGLTLFPYSSFKIFKFITHPSAQDYDDIIRLPLSDAIKLKILDSSQRDLVTFIRICCQTRQFEHLFKRLAKMKSIVILNIISTLESEGFFNPSAFICSPLDTELIQEFDLSVDQMVTVSTLTNKSSLLPALRWIRKMFLLKYADQSSFLFFLSKFPSVVRENALVSLLCNLWKGSIEIQPLATLIHQLLDNELIQSATKKVSVGNEFNPFEMVLDACCPEDTQPNGLSRIKRLVKFMEFRASPASQCAVTSCGCSIFSNPLIPSEILQNSLVECVANMLKSPSVPTHTRSGLDLKAVAELMQTHLKPLHDVILSSQQVSSRCLLLPLITCTDLPRFTSLVDYGVEPSNCDYFYPLFKLVFIRESRQFSHFEFLFQLPRQESITYENFAVALASASNERVSDKWLEWFRSVLKKDLHPFRLKYLSFLMSFPKQSELDHRLKNLWSDIFKSVIAAIAAFSVLQPLLDLHSAHRPRWASHIAVILEICPTVAHRANTLPTFISICRYLIQEEGISAISTFLQHYCSSLARDRVDAGRRQFFESLLTSLKALFVEANKVMEWNQVGTICCRILNSKKKVQEVMRAAM